MTDIKKKRPVPDHLVNNLDAFYCLYRIFEDNIPKGHPIISKNIRDFTQEDWDYVLDFSTDRDKVIEHLIKKFGRSSHGRKR